MVRGAYSAIEGRGSGLGGSSPACLPAADHARDVEDDRPGPDGAVEAGGIGVAELGGQPVRPRRQVGVGDVPVAEVVAGVRPRPAPSPRARGRWTGRRARACLPAPGGAARVAWTSRAARPRSPGSCTSPARATDLRRTAVAGSRGAYRRPAPYLTRSRAVNSSGGASAVGERMLVNLKRPGASEPGCCRP